LTDLSGYAKKSAATVTRSLLETGGFRPQLHPHLWWAPLTGCAGTPLPLPSAG